MKVSELLEGKMVKGPGGVPLGRDGKPVPPKVAPFKAPKEVKPKINLDSIFYDLTSLIGTFFPDGDPADYFPKYYRQHGIDYTIARKAFKKNGYKDEYEYIDQMKVDFPMEGVVDTVKKGIKSIKRGLQGWGDSGDLAGNHIGPKALVARNKAHDDETVKSLAKEKDLGFPFGSDKKQSPHSPRGLQKRVLGRELIKRNLQTEGRGDWDTNASDYQGDYGGSKNWGKREREDDENHAIDDAMFAPWYLRVDGKILKDESDKMMSFKTKKLASAYGYKLYDADKKKEIFLTQNPK